MDIKQLRLTLAEKNTQVKALAAKAELTPEELATWDALLVEMEGIKANIERVEHSAQVDAFVTEPAGTKAAHLGWTNAQVEVTLDEGDRPFQSLGEQMLAVKTHAVHGKLDPRLAKLNEKALGMSEAVGADGGFLLQPNFNTNLIQPIHEVGPFTRFANWLPTSGAISGRLNGIDETSRATGSRWGSIRGYRDGEGVSATSSAPKVRPIEWRLKKYRVFAYVTDELLADQAQLDVVLRQGAGEELDFMANDDVLNGTGVGGPWGIMNSACLVIVAKEAGQGAATVVKENIDKMWQRLSSRSKSNAIWFVNTEVSPELEQLAYTVGVAGVPAYMPPGGAADAPYGRLKGRPVMETEFNAALGTVGDICVFDMAWYLMWEKGPAESFSSTSVQFLTDETAFKFVYRCDGQPSLAAALTPYKGTATTSPFVALDTRA